MLNLISVFAHHSKRLTPVILSLAATSAQAIDNNPQPTSIPYLAEDVRGTGFHSTPESEEQICTAVSLRANALGSWGRVKKDPLRIDSNVPSCLTSSVTEIWNKCEKRTDLIQGKGDFRDDCVVESLMNFYSPLMDESVRISLKIGEPLWKVSKRGSNDKLKTEAPHWAEVYLDQKCQWMPELPTEGLTCKVAIDWLVSPISLVWNGETLAKESKIVQFALDPSKPSQWVAWRASADAPLLVYDPTHRGQITSGAQLFGSWTFGGQTVASLIDSNATPWENGYQPLATLDQNGDRVLSDSELEPLGLWFDANKDAISQTGEVVRLQDTGVTKLYTNPDGRDDKEQLVFATLGYERQLEGRTIVKASIDWFSFTGDSITDVAARYLQSQKAVSLDPQNRTSRSEEDHSKTRSAESLKLMPEQNLADKLLGIWKWKTNEEESSKTQGLFIFGKKNGFLTGYSIVEFGYSESDQPTNHTVRVTKMNFESISPDGTITFSATPDSSEQVRIITTIKLSTNGATLTGNSTLLNQKTQRTLRYSWMATR